jgi:hypothetical protein
MIDSMFVIIGDSDADIRGFVERNDPAEKDATAKSTIESREAGGVSGGLIEYTPLAFRHQIGSAGS